MYEKYSVLFVDDEINILSSLRRGLIDEEFACYFVGSGKEALELMAKKPVHVIVSDMRMPEMTGLALLKQVSDLWPKTVKIVLSGYTQIQQVLATINQIDIFKFITKPWDLDDFILIVQKALDYYILQEENEKNKKTLEAQNLVYQNMLKKVDDVVAHAKNSTELLCMIGKAIYGYEKKLDIEQRIKYENFFSIEDSLFDAFGKAVVNEKKEYNSSELGETFSIYMNAYFPNAKLEIENNTTTAKVPLNIKLIEAAIRSIKLIFKEELKDSAQAAKISLKDENQISMSIIFRRPSTQNEEEKTEETSLFDIKLDFINEVITTAMSMVQIEFNTMQIDNNIAIVFSNR